VVGTGSVSKRAGRGVPVDGDHVDGLVPRRQGMARAENAIVCKIIFRGLVGQTEKVRSSSRERSEGGVSARVRGWGARGGCSGRGRPGRRRGMIQSHQRSHGSEAMQLTCSSSSSLYVLFIVLAYVSFLNPTRLHLPPSFLHILSFFLFSFSFFSSPLPYSSILSIH
jgi:hypothetical protein